MASIQLRPETGKKFFFLADSVDRPAAPFLQEIIEQGMDDWEDGYLASEILRRVDQGTEKTYSAQEMRVALGLED